MHIINRTPLLAEVFVATDVEVRNHAVAVLKGTFSVGPGGDVGIAAEQVPFVFADQPAGEPGLSSTLHECDFVLRKPWVDILIRGSAHAPQGRTVRQLDVAVRVGTLSKVIRVFGDRRWEGTPLTGFRPSMPEPFTALPIVYERAFGGPDAAADPDTPRDTDTRNPVGVGFRTRARAEALSGSPLPNLEDPSALIGQWDDRPRPMGFGPVGRNWRPRVTRAGTYDDAWLANRFPFLPLDFDPRYFQAAPEDQQYPELVGGEEVRCQNLTPDGEWVFQVPRIAFSVAFAGRDRVQVVTPRIDTMILEPDQGRFILVWRGSIPVGRKIHDLRQVLIGRISPGLVAALERGKAFFPSLEALVEWNTLYTMTR
jgi:hypothetical protein